MTTTTRPTPETDTPHQYSEEPDVTAATEPVCTRCDRPIPPLHRSAYSSQCLDCRWRGIATRPGARRTALVHRAAAASRYTACGRHFGFPLHLTEVTSEPVTCQRCRDDDPRETRRLDLANVGIALPLYLGNDWLAAAERERVRIAAVDAIRALEAEMLAETEPTPEPGDLCDLCGEPATQYRWDVAPTQPVCDRCAAFIANREACAVSCGGHGGDCVHNGWGGEYDEPDPAEVAEAETESRWLALYAPTPAATADYDDLPF